MAFEPFQSRRRRRVALLVLLVVVVLLGAGIGTFVGDGPGDSPPVVTVTPTETPTPDGPGGDATETPVGPPAPETETAAQTATPTPGDTPDGDPGENSESTDERGSDESDGGGSESSGEGGGSGGDGSSSDPSVSLDVVGPTAILGYDDVAPGSSGRETVRLRNGGNREANVTVANLTVRDDENGIVGVEASVDDTPDAGELSANVVATISVEYPDGRTASLYGTGNGTRSLRALGNETDPAVGRELAAGDEATVIVDWHVPVTAGNEIQSDSVEVDVTFGLRTA